MTPPTEFPTVSLVLSESCRTLIQNFAGVAAAEKSKELAVVAAQKAKEAAIRAKAEAENAAAEAQKAAEEAATEVAR
jgi:hypothetical protein